MAREQRLEEGAVRGAVMEFLVDNALLEPDDQGARAPDLSELLDSIAVMSVVQFLEERYDLEIPDEDLTPKNLLSLEGISDYIRSRLERG